MIAVARAWQEPKRPPNRSGKGRPRLTAVAAPERGLQLPLIPEDDLRPRAGGPDRPPEQTHYRDDGCRFWRACLSCPFPRCLFEEPGGASRALNAYRDGEIRRMFAAGRSAVEIADHFGLARRSVYRVLGGIRRQAGGGQWAVGSRERTPKSRSHLPRRG